MLTSKRKTSLSRGSSTRAVVQRRATLRSSGDVHEREADAVADRVLRMPEPVAPYFAGSGTSAGIQRKGATSGGAKAVQAKSATPASVRAASVNAPGSGAPLPASERAFFEPRFGFDFRSVRVHHDETAGAAAQSIGANAYTYGSDVVFAPGQWQPGTDSGRRILAHELAHVVQQSGGEPSLSLSPVQDEVQRTCAATPCPLVALPVTALFPVWKQAELCIQDKYVETHPGNTISRNREWLWLNGRSPVEKQALRCLKNEGFTGKSGMFAGEPDLWDFTNATMYEITTPSGTLQRVGKLDAEIKLANKITSKMDCGGMSFDAGRWAPAAPCYWMGGDLYMQVFNVDGVLVYHALKDATKEALLASLLATLAAAAKSGMLQRLGGALAQKLGGRLVPGYAVASAVAAILLISAGRAEAKIGFGGDEPLIALFKALEQQGTPVPPEIRKMIESDPELKKIVEEAMTGKKPPAAAEKELNDKILKIINDNKDQFSAEDLKVLLAVTQSAGSALPSADVTVETLKKAIATKEAEKGKAQQGGAGGGSGGKDLLARATPPQRQIYSTLFSSKGAGPAITDEELSQFFAIVPPDLSDDDVARILAQALPYKGGSVADLLGGLTTALAALRMPETGASTQASAVTDEVSGSIIAPPDAQGAAEDLVAGLASIVRRSDYSKVGENVLFFQVQNEEVKVGKVLNKTLLTMLRGKRLAGVITLKITQAGDQSMTAQITGSSVLVDAERNQVVKANALVSTKKFKIVPNAASKK